MKRKFFAAFLSLCMVMSLVPMTALAAENDVAQVGDTTYATLETAFSAAQNGQEIKLLNDVTLDKLISVTKTVTLDLNGHDITSNGPVFSMNTNGIEFTIRDKTNQGEIKSTENGQCNLIEVYNGELIVEGGNFSNNWYVIYVCQSGIATIKGGSLTSTVASVLSTNGSAEGNANYSGDAVMNVEGGTLTSVSDVTIYVPAGTLNVSGGTITGATAIYSKSGNTMITDGTIKGTGEKKKYQHYSSGCAATGDAIVVEACDYPNGEPVVNISGGTFESKSNQAVAKYHTEGNESEGEIVVIGGTFVGSKEVDESSDITAYFPEGAFLTQDGTTGAVTPRAPGDGETVIAEVNSVPYNSIKNAINAAQDGDTVVLKATSTSNDSIVISDGRSIKLDMNGFDIGFAKQKNISLYHGKLNITGKGMLYEESPWFGPVMIYGAEENVSNYSVVTIGEDVTLRGWSGLFIDQHNAHGAQAYGIEATVYGTLESVKDTSGAGGHALYINGTIKETTGNVPKITLDGATLKTELGNGMYLAGYADTTIVDSTITSIGKDSTGIEIRAGKLTIKGNTTVTASQGEVEVLPNGNGSTSANVALAVAQHTTKLPIELTVTGGTFIGGAALNEMNPQKNNPEDIARVSLKVSGGEFIGIINSEDFAEFITGGHFSSPVDQDYLETDLTAELYSLRNTATPYSYYPSVEEAQAAAQPGDVVTDLSTVKEDAKQFTITFDYGDGTKKTVELWEGAETTLPTLNDRGYNHFVGWSDQAGNHYNGGQTVKITVDMTFTAQWTYIPPANPNYQIAIGDFANGTVTANPSAAKAGATVTLTATPDEGYALGTLTVTDRFGDAVRVTEQANGTYTFTMPDGQVTVTATFVETEAPVAEPFIDVAEGDWFYDAVVYAYQNELMDGVGGNRFAPNSETTRAQLVTILYRLEGQPAVSGDLPFTDVETGIWYTDAILWAAQNNIVNGVSDTEFAPGDEITRQQLVTILYRYAEAKGYDVSASADLSGYPDADQVQDYAQPAMAWAVAENIIQGMEDGTLKPAGNASRAQIATILMRFCEDVAQ